MTFSIHPSAGLSGTFEVPGDKSISHRAAILGALASGITKITNYLRAEDCLNTIDCLRRLGISIADEDDGTIVIIGRGRRGLTSPSSPLDVGNSGTAIRLLMGVLAGQPFTTTLTGDTSIQKRPMKRVAAPLIEMGAAISGRDGEFRAPVTVSGGDLKGIRYTLPVASAQVKSAILLAGLFAEGTTVVNEPVPTRDHTERLMTYMGNRLGVSHGSIQLSSAPLLQGMPVDVPGDISSAAFFIVGALIVPHSRITIQNVGLNPTRTGMIDVLKAMGGNILISNERDVAGEPRGNITIESSRLKATGIEGALIPRVIDELPILAVAATQAQGDTIIRNAEELRVKESDRIATLSGELRKLGAKIDETADGMVIHGPTPLLGTPLTSHGDHRIAMSGAIAGLAAAQMTLVENTACVETSFPGFESLMKKVSR